MKKIIDWLVYMIGYALILITISVIFKNVIYIDNNYFGMWGLIAAIIIYVLNKTVKPILFWLTLPITGLTLGLFYPVLNVIVLNIVDFLLGNHFIIHGFFMSVIVSICISIMNLLMDNLIINPIVERSNRK